jgi:hypothetical protein
MWPHQSRGSYATHTHFNHAFTRIFLEIRSLENSEGCSYETYEGIDQTLQDESFQELVGQSSRLSRQLDQAKRQGKIIGAVQRVFIDGESENFSHFYFRVIFTNGHVLSVNLDRTT